jgi:hypothetical protein
MKENGKRSILTIGENGLIIIFKRAENIKEDGI